MPDGEDVIFDYLEALPFAEMKRQMEVGCQRLFRRIHNQNVAEQRFDFTPPASNASEEEKWQCILRNSLVTVWNDSRNERIADKDVLFEEVLGIGEAIERSGYDAGEAFSLLSEFLVKSE